MKYFEIHDPYYTLMKAENKETANLEYNASVAGTGEETEAIKEVSRDYALVKFARGKSEDGSEVPVEHILDDFNNQGLCLLLIDGRLL